MIVSLDFCEFQSASGDTCVFSRKTIETRPLFFVSTHVSVEKSAAGSLHRPVIRAYEEVRAIFLIFSVGGSVIF